MSNTFILDMTISWWASGLRYVFAFLDWIVYYVIQIFFSTIFNLANFELVGFYESFEERIYVILGIFMLFKVTISLLTYLVNPDRITDKEQGMSKVIIRIITVLMMLIALPTAFNLLTEFQNKLIPVIPRVIVGTATTMNGDSASAVANKMSTTMIQGFAHKKAECEGQEIDDLNYFLTHINDQCSESNNTYKYDYLPLISTLVGVLMVYVLFSLCISTAIRAFKLIILRAIAPVPVISYIDPKSSKNGMFSTWIKTFLSVWAELFVLIGTIYFIVYLIDFLLSGEAWRGFFDGISNPIEGVFLLAFVLIGLLFFAKQAPQFVFDALGIKSKGAFTRMLGMGATALGMGGSAISAYRTSSEVDPNRSFARNAATGLFSGLRSGFVGGAALMDEKATYNSGINAQSKFNKNNIGMIEKGATLGGRISAFSQNLLLGETAADRYDRRIKKVGEYEKMLKDHKGVIESRFDGSDDFVYQSSAWSGELNFNVVKRMIEASNGDPDSEVTKSALEWLADNNVDTKEFLANEDSIHKAGYCKYAETNGASSNSTLDVVVQNSVSVTANGLNGAYVYEYDNDGNVTASHNLGDLDMNDYKNGVKEGIAQTSTETTQIKSSDRYSTAQANKSASGSGN